MSVACALKIPLNGWIQKHWYTLMHLFFCIILNPICDVQYDKILESMKLLGLPLRGFWEPWRLGLTIKNPKGTFDSEMLMNATCMYISFWLKLTHFKCFLTAWRIVYGAHASISLQFVTKYLRHAPPKSSRLIFRASRKYREYVLQTKSTMQRIAIAVADTCAQTLTLIARCLHDSSKGPYELLWLLLAGLQNKNELFLACGQSRQFMVC